ncbi:hypothetical protein QVA66_11795, partial [Staphylococcus chromogenes]|nr:hypothetical protein [Staphylococcus chromogenes]
MISTVTQSVITPVALAQTADPISHFTLIGASSPEGGKLNFSGQAVAQRANFALDPMEVTVKVTASDDPGQSIVIVKPVNTFGQDPRLMNITGNSQFHHEVMLPEMFHGRDVEVEAQVKNLASGATYSNKPEKYKTVHILPTGTPRAKQVNRPINSVSINREGGDMVVRYRNNRVSAVNCVGTITSVEPLKALDEFHKLQDQGIPADPAAKEKVYELYWSQQPYSPILQNGGKIATPGSVDAFYKSVWTGNISAQAETIWRGPVDKGNALNMWCVDGNGGMHTWQESYSVGLSSQVDTSQIKPELQPVAGEQDTGTLLKDAGLVSDWSQTISVKDGNGNPVAYRVDKTGKLFVDLKSNLVTGPIRFEFKDQVSGIVNSAVIRVSSVDTTQVVPSIAADGKPHNIGVLAQTPDSKVVVHDGNGNVVPNAGEIVTDGKVVVTLPVGTNGPIKVEVTSPNGNIEVVEIPVNTTSVDNKPSTGIAVPADGKPHDTGVKAPVDSTVTVVGTDGKPIPGATGT